MFITLYMIKCLSPSLFLFLFPPLTTFLLSFSISVSLNLFHSFILSLSLILLSFSFSLSLTLPRNLSFFLSHSLFVCLSLTFFVSSCLSLSLSSLATDAARAAADIILTEPGLSTIVDGIVIARCIFVRIRNFVTYRIAATVQLLVFFFIAVFAFKPIEYMPIQFAVRSLLYLKYLLTT